MNDIADEDGSKAETPISIYYYHPDHLGSNTFITDISGKPYQLFLNLPFGESMAEQSSLGYFQSPYKFNGKELDKETGLYYYGARYYDPRTSVWLSMDPLAAKYPKLSPYVFCANNPIIFIDNDGSYFDWSKVSPEGRARIESTFLFYSMESSLFKEVYKQLSTSPKPYLIELGQTSLLKDGRSANAEFESNAITGGGTIRFLNLSKVGDSYTTIEESFHAYQNDVGQTVYNAGKSINKEYEAKVFGEIVRAEIGSANAAVPGTEYIFNYMKDKDGFSIFPSKQQIHSAIFQQVYQDGANKFVKYSKIQGYVDNPV